jgi:hypothetical protein
MKLLSREVEGLALRSPATYLVQVPIPAAEFRFGWVMREKTSEKTKRALFSFEEERLFLSDIKN